MRLSRDVPLRIHFLLDECLPPIVRDQRWFMGHRSASCLAGT